ncbi:hypothetical protein ACHIPZ_13635 [Antrihabitans sp. NCIMB 15449]|uniref:Uncharacterized protein n=1 Tax=Antrihabitans spumae TaxID=3373370 RepID=A0ABW7JNK5_9NOCA
MTTQPDREYAVRLPDGSLAGESTLGFLVTSRVRTWSDAAAAQSYVDDLRRHAATRLGVADLAATVVWRYVGEWCTDATADQLVTSVERFLESGGTP